MTMTNQDITDQARALMRALCGCGVAKIIVEYSGSGDSGGVDSVAILDTEGNEIGEAAKLMYGSDFQDEVEEIVIDLSEADFNNDGSQGTATWNMDDMTLDIEHQWNEMTATDDFKAFDFNDEPLENEITADAGDGSGELLPPVTNRFIDITTEE